MPQVYANPVKSYREQLGLSINQFAELAQINRQVLIRTEQGCYESIPPKICRFLEQRLGLDFLDPCSSLNSVYHDWITVKRQSSYGLLVEPLPEFNPTIHPFVQWRELSNLNRTATCRTFCIHQSTLTRFETNLQQASIPDQVYNALRESGYASNVLDDLSVRYKLYRELQLCSINNRDASNIWQNIREYQGLHYAS